MKMIRHHHEFMQLKSASIAAGKNALNQYFRNLWYPEELTPFPGCRGHEIRASGEDSMAWLAHQNFRG